MPIVLCMTLGFQLDKQSNGKLSGISSCEISQPSAMWWSAHRTESHRSPCGGICVFQKLLLDLQLANLLATVTMWCKSVITRAWHPIPQQAANWCTGHGK